jgi:uncharacterized protein (UPF0333 family)
MKYLENRRKVLLDLVLLLALIVITVIVTIAYIYLP